MTTHLESEKAIFIKNCEDGWRWLEDQPFDYPTMELFGELNRILMDGLPDGHGCGQLRTRNLQPILTIGGIHPSKEHSPPKASALPSKAEEYFAKMEEEMQAIPYNMDDLPNEAHSDVSYLKAVMPFLSMVHYGVFLGQFFPNGNKRTAAMLTNYYAYSFFPGLFDQIRESGHVHVVDADANTHMTFATVTKNVWKQKNFTPFCCHLYRQLLSAFGTPQISSIWTTDFGKRDWFFDLVTD